MQTVVVNEIFKKNSYLFNTIISDPSIMAVKYKMPNAFYIIQLPTLIVNYP